MVRVVFLCSVGCGHWMGSEGLHLEVSLEAVWFPRSEFLGIGREFLEDEVMNSFWAMI